VFDRTRLRLQPLSERTNDLDVSYWLELDAPAPPFAHPDLPALAARMARARQGGRPVILMMGAHVIRAGVSRHIIDLMERRAITHVAMNGAGAIHEYELARIGATSESVARYIRSGEFGLWRETGLLNEWIAEAAQCSAGMGETIGRKLLESDFLIFTRAVEQLEGGVLLNFGSAVMGPEVYLKALAMARNVAVQEGREIRHFATAVFDLRDIPGDFRSEAPKSDANYYFRPYKTILVRTVAEGGESFYFRGDHRATLPALRQLMLKAESA
jgi:hypothetical protein